MTSTINSVISVSSVSKSFGKNRVLSQVNFKMPRGMIYGISGANGVGKSVFLRILSGLVLPDEGEVAILGKRVGKDCEFAPSMGILMDTQGFLLSKSGMENLSLLASVSGKANRESIVAWMCRFGLDPLNRKTVSTYSTGMRQRLGLVQALMENPDILILDEPTSGLDFEGQREIYSGLIELKQQGKTILITSHNRDELEILCDEMFTLIDGNLLNANGL